MKELQKYREKIDEIDSQLIKLLAERFEITHQVGLTKAKLNLPPIDKEREQMQFEKIEKLSEEFGVDKNLTMQILRIIIDKVVEDHKNIAKNNTNRIKT
jgi:chorismate mutase